MSSPREEKNYALECHSFDWETIKRLAQTHFIRNSWPVVYILSSASRKEAYIGESTRAFIRFQRHLDNPQKRNLDSLYLITSPHFNKSATLDIEASLIRYFNADSSIGKKRLLNGNLGLTSTNYYEKQEYIALFEKIWKQLQQEKITIQDLKAITNSDLFKFSPYKALSPDQYQSMLELIDMLNSPDTTALVEGGAGTGKTVLAIFLLKLLVTSLDELYDVDIEPDEEEPSPERKLVRQLKELYPAPKVALVIAMESLRNTLKAVFKDIKGLKAGMVIGPAEVVGKNYDILIVDEAHRLRQRKNITNYRSFDEKNKALGLGNDGTELDWILRSSKKQIVFYDRWQTVKPSDVPQDRFDSLRQSSRSIKLHSQLRVKGGADYISFVEQLMNARLSKKTPKFEQEGYEFLLFDHIADMANAIAEKEKEHQLSRIVAGYSWKWKSKKEPSKMDIEIEGMHFQWNQEYNQWINSKNAAREIGCIHTTQGYDLNYVGVIFGNEISYDPRSKEINIRPEYFYDKKTKAGIKDVAVLKQYILNIYQNMLYRGINGVYVYVCNPALRDYFKKHIRTYTP
jgi:DUF2075 family protein